MPPRFYLLLTVAQRALQRRVAADLPGSISASQAGVLFLLGSSEGPLIGDVARGLGATASSLTELIDRMATAGLVERRTDLVDGRAQRLFLTEPGREVRQIAQSQLATLNNLLTDGFNPDELAVVARWLVAVRDRSANRRI